MTIFGIIAIVFVVISCVLAIISIRFNLRALASIKKAEIEAEKASRTIDVWVKMIAARNNGSTASAVIAARRAELREGGS